MQQRVDHRLLFPGVRDLQRVRSVMQEPVDRMVYGNLLRLVDVAVDVHWERRDGIAQKPDACGHGCTAERCLRGDIFAGVRHRFVQTFRPVPIRPGSSFLLII